jgi:hypothetical protein
VEQVWCIHVLFCHSFVVFLWPTFPFNQVIDDSLAGLCMQDFLYFADFFVIEKFGKGKIWFDMISKKKSSAKLFNC